MRRGARVAALAVLVAAAAPALAYLLPPATVLKRMAQRREELALASLEVRGTLAVEGEAARALAVATASPLSGSEVLLPAVLTIKAPGRCRLDLLSASGAPGPFLSLGRGKVAGGKGLERVPAVLALVRATCALLGTRPAGPDPGRAYADELFRLGIALSEDYLAHMGGRVAYVLGAPPREKKPQAWIDKQSFQPVRLLASFAGPLADVRLVDYGSPVGGDMFPRAVEVFEGGTLSLRLTTEKLAANPKVPDALFP